MAREITKRGKLFFGKIKWYSPREGYGFAKFNDIPGDVVFDKTAIQNEGKPKTLKHGNPIKCKIVHGPKGYRAIQVFAL